MGDVPGRAGPARRHRQLRRRAGTPSAPGPQLQGVGGAGRLQPPPVVGGKLCLALNHLGQIIGWAWATANAHDTWFHPVVEVFKDRCVMLADTGFHAAEDDPPDLKICRRGRWNVRMLVETVNSMLTVVSHTKKMRHQAMGYFSRILPWRWRPSTCWPPGTVSLHGTTMASCLCPSPSSTFKS